MSPTIQATSGYASNTNTISNVALSISDGSWGWGATDLAEAEKALVSTATAAIRISVTKSINPTTINGTFIPKDGSLEVVGNRDILNLSLIRTSVTDSDVTIQLFKF